MQHVRYAHVIDEWLLAERLLQPALPTNRVPDSVFGALTLGKGRVPAEPELLAEEQVPPRLFGERPAVTRGLAGRLYGVDDATVTGTPAEMPVERLRVRVR
jgi:hypothetical protein